MSEKGQTIPPSPTGWDYAHTAAKVVISALPYVGGPAAELFEKVVTSPLSRRRDKWLTELFQKINKLQECVSEFDPVRLAHSDEFLSAFLQAAGAALKTHQTEKLNALRNSVLNVALGRAPDEDQQTIFLSYVDGFTPWHLRILKFFESPLGLTSPLDAVSDQTFGGSLSGALEDRFQELRGRRDFYNQIVRDLSNRGLLAVNDEVLFTMMTGIGLVTKRTTALGDQFLSFINEPQV
jgi:hypothetical protein